MRVLVTGGRGQLAAEFPSLVAPAECLAPSREELDVRDADAVSRVIDELGPTLVVHAAAWTDVDGAESDPAGAFAANETGSRNVARAARAVGADLVAYSTDYVFDGDASDGYVESDEPAPRSVYGASKLAGEVAVREEHPDAYVIRTAWVFGSRGKNFVRTMLRLGAELDELRVVDDQRGNPTYTRHLAEATLALTGTLPSRHVPPDRQRLVHVVRARLGDHDLRRPARPRRPDRERRAGPSGGTTRVLDPTLRARLHPDAATVAGRSRGLPVRALAAGGPTLKRILVTGGCGFIGSHFVRRMLTRHPALEVVNLDALTYAGNPRNLEDVADDPRYRFVHGSIADREAIAEAADGVDAIVNFAAETHVDRSIHAGTEFVTTNVLGPMALLDWLREHGGRLVHVSTDEVYGDIEPGEASEEGDALRPSSPYSAAKAGGDLQVLASVRTYGVDALITRGSNTYGPYQYPEKMIPLFATNLLDGQPVPVYGDGRQARDFIWVEDHCAGIELVLDHGAAGEIYNVGGGHEIENVETTRRLLELTGRDETLIQHVADRPGHDRRYALDCSKLRGLGWAPETSFADGLERTVAWYRERRDWWEPIKRGDVFEAYSARQYGART